MSYLDIENTIRNLAETEDGKKKLEARRKMMIKMSNASENTNIFKKDYLRNRRNGPGIVFTLNQGNLLKADQKGSLRLNVEMRGEGIGCVERESLGSPFYFSSKDKTMDKLQWSHKRKDGEEIRNYLWRKDQELSGESKKERELQWMMYTALEKDIKDLRPVALAGCRSEIPTWINSNGKPGTGNIDALIRKRRGNTGGKFIVFELKRHGEEKPTEALKQAIYYAIALSLEANGNNDRQCAYRTLFGVKGVETPLSFGAVAVVQDTEKNRKLGLEALNNFELPIAREGYKPLVDSLNILYYQWDKEKSQPYNWQWLLPMTPEFNRKQGS